MKKLLTLLFSIFGIFIFSQKIVWKEGNKLFWNQFKSKQNIMKSDTTIVSYASCGLRYTAAKDKQSNRIKILIEATFDPSNSWKHPNKTVGLSTNHEQGHFDIAEIYARKLRKYFAENIKTEKDYQIKFKLTYQMLYGEFLVYENSYDKATKRGTIPEKQKELEEEIKRELKKLEAFKN